MSPQSKGLDQSGLHFYAEGRVSKTMPLLLKINCLKLCMTLKFKCKSQSFKVPNCMALIHGGVNAGA